MNTYVLIITSFFTLSIAQGNTIIIIVKVFYFKVYVSKKLIYKMLMHNMSYI